MWHGVLDRQRRIHGDLACHKWGFQTASTLFLSLMGTIGLIILQTSHLLFHIDIKQEDTKDTPRRLPLYSVKLS